MRDCEVSTAVADKCADIVGLGEIPWDMIFQSLSDEHTSIRSPFEPNESLTIAIPLDFTQAQA
jgi:hypothetical protein